MNVPFTERVYGAWRPSPTGGAWRGRRPQRQSHAKRAWVARTAAATERQDPLGSGPLVRSRPRMRDLTDRALDTAAQLGATLRRRARHPPSRRVDLGQERARRRRRDGRDRRLRRPRPRRWRVGLRRLGHPRARRGGSRRRARGADREGLGDGASTAASSSTAGRPPPAPSRRRSRRTRSRSRSSGRSTTSIDADRAAGPSRASTFTESMYSGHREWKTFAATDGSFTEQVITQVGTAVEANAIEGDEHQRRSYPDAGGGFQAGGYEYVRSARPGRQRRPDRRGGRRAAVARRSARPALRTLVLDPSMLYLQIHESCGHPTRARPGVRHGGVLRRHQLPDAGQARRRASSTAPSS